MAVNKYNTVNRDANRLIAEIEYYGLHLLVGDQPNLGEGRMPADELIASLILHPDARLHTALMTLLLYRPSLSNYMENALERLPDDYRVKLKLYYTASAFLSKKYFQQLHSLIPGWRVLPDLYSRELGILLSNDIQNNLRLLAKRHLELTDYCVNWLGTYESAAKRLISRLNREAEWAL